MEEAAGKEDVGRGRSAPARIGFHGNFFNKSLFYPISKIRAQMITKLQSPFGCEVPSLAVPFGRVL